MVKCHPLKNFQYRFLFLAENLNDLTDLQIQQLCMAALADLAADLPEPSIDHARHTLVDAAERMQTILDDRSEAQDIVSNWKRLVMFATEDTSRRLRTRAIRKAEQVLRSLGVRSTPDAEKVSATPETYFSSTVSQ